MYWLDKEIIVVEIDGRFFALNGWDGEYYTRCWECCDRDGDKFCKMVGNKTYTIIPEQKLVIETSNEDLNDLKNQMYKKLLPYSGPANTIGGEILRSIETLEISLKKDINISGALKFLSLHLKCNTCKKIIEEMQNGDFSNFKDLKSNAETIILSEYRKNELEINYDDFENLND